MDNVKSGFGMPRRRSVRILLALVVLLLIVGAIVFLTWISARTMFYENRRLMLREVRINSAGWWKGREKELCRTLSLSPGTTYMFSLYKSAGKKESDLAALKSILEKEEPSIEQVTVRRVLPDMLVFDITERIPRVFIDDGSGKKNLLLDEKGVVIHCDKCINLSQNSLPTLVRWEGANKLLPGQRLENIDPVMEFVMLTATKYPDIRIRGIEYHHAGTGNCNPSKGCPDNRGKNVLSMDQRHIVCDIFYKNRFGASDVFLVIMPDKNIEQVQVPKLISTLEHIRRTGSDKRKINLLYDGQGGIIQPL